MIPRRSNSGNTSGCVGDQSDGQWPLLGDSLLHHLQRLVQIGCHRIYILSVETLLDAVWIAFDDQSDTTIHSDGQGLCAAHATTSAGEHEPSSQVFPASLTGGGGQRLIGTLQNALSSDVDPGTGGHLAIHDQSLVFQFVKFIPGGPVRDQH